MKTPGFVMTLFMDGEPCGAGVIDKKPSKEKLAQLKASGLEIEFTPTKDVDAAYKSMNIGNLAAEDGKERS